jgi:outer membrane protein OmpA-like peptidoglycan-associated protein
MGAAANLAGDVTGGGSSMLLKLLPLLALALLGFLGYKQFAGDQMPHDNAHKPAINTKAGMPAKAMVDSALNIVVKDGKYVISGVVPDEKTKAEIIAKAKAAYGEGNVDASGLKIDANAKAPDWLAKLGDAFGALKGAASGTVLSFAGAAVKLEGIAGAAADALLAKLKGFFPAITMAAPINEAAVAEEAEKKAAEALTALPANFTAAQLVEALNLEIINFASGDATIPKDREDLLTKSAEYIKKLPADAKIEVGGHTDNRGAAAGNLTLSGKRADAVKAFLVKAGVNAAALTSKGYGLEHPKASNDTDAGRFANRRIEFTVAK